MTLATSLRQAARKLIDTFGNTCALYSISGATKTNDSEGDLTISSWGTATNIKVVDGEGAQGLLEQLDQGVTTLGDDEKIIRDDVTINLNDRITVNSVDYKIVEVTPTRTQDTVVIYIIKVERVRSTSSW